MLATVVDDEGSCASGLPVRRQTLLLLLLLLLHTDVAALDDSDSSLTCGGTWTEAQLPLRLDLAGLADDSIGICRCRLYVIFGFLSAFVNAF